MKLISYLIIFVCWLSMTSAVVLTTKELNDGSQITISMPTNELIKFEITNASKDWIGVGFGKSIDSIDAFIIEENGKNSTITDMHTDANGKLVPDVNNDYTLKTTSVDGQKIFTVTRKLNTRDKEDFAISEGENPIMILSPNGEFQEEFILTAKLVNRKLASSGGSSKNSQNALLHGLFCYFAWDWFSVLLIISGRYSKYFYTFRIYVHAVIGIMAVAFNIIGVAFSNIETPGSANGLGDAHTGLAGIVTAWAIGVSVIGLICKIAGRWFRHLSWITIWSRVLHLIASYILIVYSQFVMLSGLYLYDSPITYLFYIHVGCMLLILAGFEITFCWLTKWKYEYIDELHRKNVPDMSIDVFLQSEKKLALFDNYVLDMGSYYMDHPGGAYVLEECVKMDVGKYFFGSYSMENWVNPHTHTYIAGKAMLKMVIAKLGQPLENKKVFAPRTPDNSVNLSADNSALYESSMVFTVPSKVEHIKMVYNIRFGNRKTKVKLFFPGTEMLGRHYVISSLQNHVTRYYTICNAMHTRVYPQYLKVFNSILEDGSYDLDFKTFEDINTAWDDYLELVLKLYPQSKKGITKQLLNDKDTDQFFISGPLSRGYDLTKENVSGQNVLFVGGTGVLPFIDLFAYLGRKIISEHARDKEVFPGEQFHDELENANYTIYGYYPRAKDAVAIDFCNKISQIHEKFGWPNKFKFVPVYTRDGGKRLDKEELFNLLQKHKDETGIKNLWICGPPPMNNMFQQFKKQICKRFDMHHRQVEIL